METATSPEATTGSLSTFPSVPLPSAPMYRFCVEQYLEMGRTGILTKDDRVELIEGWIVQTRAKNPLHPYVSSALQELLGAIVPVGWYLRVEQPVVLGESVPEPDLLVAKGTRSDYRARNPGASETALVIEIAESSLLHDRINKKREYARAGMVCYWLVDLVHSLVEVYTGSSGPTESPDYAKVERVEAEGTLIFHIEDQEIGRIAVREIFP